MKYQRPHESLVLPQPYEEASDVGLARSLAEAYGTDKEPYQELTLSPQRKQSAKEAWHSGREADLTIDTVGEGELEARVNSLRQWKIELLDSSVDADIKQLYRWKVNEMIGNTHMLVASSRGDMKDFRRWGEFVYGKPDEQIYRAALDWVAHDAENLLAVPDQQPSIIQAARDVLDMLDGDRGYREILAPDAETFETVRQDHMARTGYYGLLLSGVEIPEGKITPAVGDPILRQVIRNIGSQKPIIDSDNATWGVNSEGVKRPPKYNMPHLRYIGLGLGHEIGSHELERTNGARGPIYLAKEGLDRYEQGNEGRAVIREQVVYDNFDEFGKLVRWRDILRRHISISHAWGVGSESSKSQLETYEFMNTIDLMYQTKLKPSEPELAKSAAQNKTDNLLLRVLRGGDVYLKDKVYLEGHVASWLTASVNGPGAISDGDLGKFDINSSRHVKALQSRGLLPVYE